MLIRLSMPSDTAVVKDETMHVASMHHD
jgi:hypothetical protein